MIALFVFALIAGILAIENLIWGQFMISRPVIFVSLSGVILHWLFGLPVSYEYLLLMGGVILELFYLFSLPIGSSYVPNQVISGNFLILSIIYLNMRGIIPTWGNWATILVFVLFLSIITSFSGAYVDILMRKFNSYLVEYSKRFIESGDIKSFEAMSKWGFILFFLSNFIQLIFYYFLLLLFSKPFITVFSSHTQINKIALIFFIGFIAKVAINIFRKLRKTDLPWIQGCFLLLLTFLTGLNILWHLLIVVFLVIFVIRESRGINNG